MITVVMILVLSHVAENVDDKTNLDHTVSNAMSQKVQGALGAQDRSIHPGPGVEGQVGF